MQSRADKAKALGAGSKTARVKLSAVRQLALDSTENLLMTTESLASINATLNDELEKSQKMQPMIKISRNGIYLKIISPVVCSVEWVINNKLVSGIVSAGSAIVLHAESDMCGQDDLEKLGHVEVKGLSTTEGKALVEMGYYASWTIVGF